MIRLSGNWLRKTDSRERIAEKSQRVHDFLIANGYSLVPEVFDYRLWTSNSIDKVTDSLLIDFGKLGISAGATRKESRNLVDIAQTNKGISRIVKAMELPKKPTEFYERPEPIPFLGLHRIRHYFEIPSLTIMYSWKDRTTRDATLQVIPQISGKFYYGRKGFDSLQKEGTNSLWLELQRSDPFKELVLYVEVDHGSEFNGRGGLNEGMTKRLVKAVKSGL